MVGFGGVVVARRLEGGVRVWRGVLQKTADDLCVQQSAAPRFPTPIPHQAAGPEDAMPGDTVGRCQALELLGLRRMEAKWTP